MVYLQSVEWTGPVDPNTARADHYGREILITRSPGKTNMSGEPKINGWLGTTNDWYRWANGEFATVPAARAAAEKLFGTLYEPDADEANQDDDVIEVWYDRERAAAHWQASEWLHDARHDLLAQLRAGKSIDALTEELEAEAADMADDTPAGVILHGTRDYLKSLLDEDTR